MRDRDRDGVHHTEQVHIVLGGRAVARRDDDREALDVVNHVLGGGLSSRLFEELNLEGPYWNSTELFDDGRALYGAVGVEGVIAK